MVRAVPTLVLRITASESVKIVLIATTAPTGTTTVPIASLPVGIVKNVFPTPVIGTSTKY